MKINLNDIVLDDDIEIAIIVFLENQIMLKEIREKIFKGKKKAR